MKKIQVGFLMSYDYNLLKNSIPPVYSAADGIFIALDANCRTWTGDSFEINPEFFNWIRNFDVDNKIEFFRDDFYDPTLSPMENEIRERKKLAEKMGIGNWLVQVDCDEYFLDFPKFADDLKAHNRFLQDPEKNRVQICAFLINLFKYVDEGVLYVDQARRQKMATNYPDYVTGRNTKNRLIYTKNLLLHESVSRSEAEVLTKFRNWGHSDEVDAEEFLKKWRAVDQNNFQDYRDFFYLEPGIWKKLKYVQGGSLPEISKNLKTDSMMPSDFFLWKKNLGQWFKFLFK